MSSLIGRFERDVLYLDENEIPREISGEEVRALKYAAEEAEDDKSSKSGSEKEGEEKAAAEVHERLTDDDIKRLSDALLKNETFHGPLELQNNNLSDLAALHLSKIFEADTGYNITFLNLKNNNFTSKAGEYIGEALARNPDYPLGKLVFGGVCLEDTGLVRIIEAVNANQNIVELNVGIITDNGLTILADLLKANESLQEITLVQTEDPQKLWTNRGRSALTQMLRKHTKLTKVRLFKDKKKMTADDKLFQDEVNFYTDMKAAQQKEKKEYQKKLDSCDNTQMFEKLLKLVEDPDSNQKMPVRRFYDNTFKQSLNRAIFQLKKEQMKNPDVEEYFTCEGMVKCVAFYMQEDLPEGELMQ